LGVQVKVKIKIKIKIKNSLAGGLRPAFQGLHTGTLGPSCRRWSRRVKAPVVLENL